MNVGNKIDRALVNESGYIKSFYKKDNRYFTDFKANTRMGLYNVCEKKDTMDIKKDIFGNQATFNCDGEQNLLVTDFPTMALEVSRDAIINFIGGYDSGRHDLFSLSPEEYLMIWSKYSVNGQDDMRIYVKDNVIMGIEQMYQQ